MKANRMNISLAIALVFIVVFFYRCGRSSQTEETLDITETEARETEVAETEEAETEEELMDFTDLQSENPDVCAYLDISEAGISYPVLQSPDDDSLYLRHDIDRNYSLAGALFTEASYNSADFTDPVTIIYGHHMLDGTMFGNLQQWFSDEQHFTEEPEITIYTPKATWHYRVFAAVPFEKWHILYNCDFTNPSVFNTFFLQISHIREIGAITDDSIEVTPEDHVVILSTCLQSDRNRRFLVCAVREDS